MLLSMATKQAGKKEPTPSVVPTTGAATMDLDGLTRPIQAQPEVFKAGQVVVTSTLAALIDTFIEQESSRKFMSEDETQPVAVNILPEEILVEIIHLLDFSSIENFARVCKKARILTLEPSIWR
jgi:F-box protein 9